MECHRLFLKINHSFMRKLVCLELRSLPGAVVLTLLKSYVATDQGLEWLVQIRVEAMVLPGTAGHRESGNDRMVSKVSRAQQRRRHTKADPPQ